MPDPRPTRPSAPAPSRPTASRADDVARFYRDRATQVLRAVAASVVSNDHGVIDDACQYAWLTLLRRADIRLDDQGAAWVITVAIREGWRLARSRGEVALASHLDEDSEGREVLEPAALDADPEGTVLRLADHDRRVKDFAQLKPLVRRDLYLKALGYSYEEIAEATGSSFTAVNRRLAEGRAKLREFASRRAALERGEL